MPFPLPSGICGPTSSCTLYHYADTCICIHLCAVDIPSSNAVLLLEKLESHLVSTLETSGIVPKLFSPNKVCYKTWLQIMKLFHDEFHVIWLHSPFFLFFLFFLCSLFLSWFRMLGSSVEIPAHTLLVAKIEDFSSMLVRRVHYSVCVCLSVHRLQVTILNRSS